MQLIWTLNKTIDKYEEGVADGTDSHPHIHSDRFPIFVQNHPGSEHYEKFELFPRKILEISTGNQSFERKRIFNRSQR